MNRGAVKAAAQAKLKKAGDIFLKSPEKHTADAIIPKILLDISADMRLIL